MSERKYPVITISREFGAGGHSIARVVSERLGIPYYDRDFAKQAAARSGYSQEDIDREGENLSRSARLLDNILNNSAGYFSSHDAIYQAQKELILQFAAEQDCIIIGRCSNLILRNAGIPSLDIFLHADVNLRTEHIQKLGLNGISISFPVIAVIFFSLTIRITLTIASFSSVITAPSLRLFTRVPSSS